MASLNGRTRILPQSSLYAELQAMRESPRYTWSSVSPAQTYTYQTYESNAQRLQQTISQALRTVVEEFERAKTEPVRILTRPLFDKTKLKLKSKLRLNGTDLQVEVSLFYDNVQLDCVEESVDLSHVNEQVE